MSGVHRKDKELNELIKYSQHLRVFVVFLEATIRFLKAKLRVMQEELDRVVAECNKKVIMIVASLSYAWDTFSSLCETVHT